MQSSSVPSRNRPASLKTLSHSVRGEDREIVARQITWLRWEKYTHSALNATVLVPGLARSLSLQQPIEFKLPCPWHKPAVQMDFFFTEPELCTQLFQRTLDHASPPNRTISSPSVVLLGNTSNYGEILSETIPFPCTVRMLIRILVGDGRNTSTQLRSLSFPSQSKQWNCSNRI